MRIRNRLLLVLLSFISIGVVLTTSIVYQVLSHAYQADLDNELYTAAIMAKDVLPADYHDKIFDKNSVSEEEYLRIVDKFNEICVKTDLEYLWSLMTLDGKLVFTSATSPGKDSSLGDQANFLNVHTAPEIYSKVFQTMQPQFQINFDRWGRLRAALIPFRDAHGRPYIVGASRSMQKVDQLMHTTLLYSIFSGAVLLVIATLLCVRLANSFSRPIEELTHVATSIADGDLSKRVHVSGTHELEVLSSNVNSMAESISERIQALATEKERLLVTLRSIGDAVITTDKDGCVTLMNKVSEELTGWSLTEASGRHLSEVFNIVNEGTHEKCVSPFETIMQSGATVALSNHTVLISKNGTEYLITDSGAPIRDNHNNIIGTILVFRDTTARIKLEETLHNTQKLESIGVLAGGIAHDFNNLLGSLFGYIEIAQMRWMKKDFARIGPYLENALSVLSRATDLTRQLLTFSKGGKPIKRTQYLPSIIKHAAQFVLSGSNSSPKFEIPQDLWPCEVDENQFGQVIDNIVINARQAMPQGGVINISAQNLDESAPLPAGLSQGRYVRISISDSGVGIPKANLSKVFDPFFTTKNSGTGLGLATAYSILRNHDGYIQIESEVGKGTNVALYLPAAKTPTQTDSAIQTQEELQQTARVLLMDDNAELRDVCSQFLVELGFSVVCAMNGSEAIKKYQESIANSELFDFVILDLTIPGEKGGKETLQELLKLNPKIVAIASSGYADDPIMAAPKEFGFAVALPKPYKKNTLAHIIATARKGITPT